MNQGSDVNNLSAIQETKVQLLDHEDPLEKGMATHSSIRTLECKSLENPMDRGPLWAIVHGITRVRHD